MEYIGLDHHKQYSVATVLKRGGEIKRYRLDNTPEEFSWLLDTEEETSVVFETGRSWPKIYEMIKDKADHIKMAHPSKVKAIASARIKTDKIDSLILAELLRADLIPESHLRGEENRSNLAVLRQRAFFVKMRTMVRNRIHYLLDMQPYGVCDSKPDVDSLWTKKGMVWLTGLSLPDRVYQELLNVMLNAQDHIDKLVSLSDGMVMRLYQNDPDAKLIDTIPGFAEFGSVLASNEIDGIDRFFSAKKLNGYSGLVPSTYSSGGRTFHGNITKQGSKWLRWIYIQAVSPAVKKNAQIAAYYKRIRRRNGKRAARVATARRLLTITYYVLKEGRPFEEYRTNQSVNHRIKRSYR